MTAPGPLTLTVIDDSHPLYPGELALRFRVLRQPLGMGRETVRYRHEDDCLHLVAERDGAVVGCVLFHPQDAGAGRLLQMAVEPSLQGQGVGALLVRRLEDELRRRGYRQVVLHARHHAIGFYEKLGYAITGEPFEEVGMSHRLMRKDL